MGLQTLIQADVATLIDRHGDEITSTPSGGEATTINVFMKGQNPAIQGTEPPSDSLTLVVKSSDISDPQKGHTFTISGETWYLVKNIGGGSHLGFWELEITRSGRRQV